MDKLDELVLQAFGTCSPSKRGEVHYSDARIGYQAFGLLEAARQYPDEHAYCIFQRAAEHAFSPSSNSRRYLMARVANARAAAVWLAQQLPGAYVIPASPAIISWEEVLTAIRLDVVIWKDSKTTAWMMWASQEFPFPVPEHVDLRFLAPDYRSIRDDVVISPISIPVDLKTRSTTWADCMRCSLRWACCYASAL